MLIMMKEIQILFVFAQQSLVNHSPYLSTENHIHDTGFGMKAAMELER